MENKNYFEGFEEKVKSMTAKEIILAMLDGLKSPVVEIDMSTYGVNRHGTCYGCAATNMICKISNINPKQVLPYYNIGSGFVRYGLFLEKFEYAIDALRRCHFTYYNNIAYNFGFAKIINTDFFEPIKQRNYADADLYSKWLDFANTQD